jgi:hypothetical protein
MPIEIKTMEEAARLYRQVEARLEAKASTYKKSIEKDTLALKQLEVVMRAMLNQAGVAKMDVSGVAEVVIVPKRVFGQSDWDRFMDWLVANNVPELMQKRIHDDNMQHWIDNHPGAELPPGLNVYTEHTLKVLKSKVKEKA